MCVTARGGLSQVDQQYGPQDPAVGRIARVQPAELVVFHDFSRDLFLSSSSIRRPVEPRESSADGV